MRKRKRYSRHDDGDDDDDSPISGKNNKYFSFILVCAISNGAILLRALCVLRHFARFKLIRLLHTLPIATGTVAESQTRRKAQI